MNYEPPKHVEINHCSFIDNNAKPEQNKDRDDYGHGWCIYFGVSSNSPGFQSDNCYLNIVNCTLKNYYAHDQGGAVLISVKNNGASKPIEINNF